MTSGKPTPCGEDWKRAETVVQDRVSDDYEEKRYQRPHSRRYHCWWTETMLGMLSPASLEGRILDNGCGNGVLGLTFPELKERITGLDISRNMVERARPRLGKVLVGDSENLPFKDETFTAVVARSLLHHLPEPEKGVSEMARVLKPGGEVVIADTNKNVLSTLPRKIANRGEHFHEDHRNMDSSELVDLLGIYFNVDEVRYFGYVAYPLLGFPDLIDFSRFAPLGGPIADGLIALDSLVSKVPGVRRLGWGIFVKGTKKD